MRIFAIGDLHLSEAQPKPMSIFGSQWINHFEKIKKDWNTKVKKEDVVLIPGDISWAMKLIDAQADLCAIGQLPGKKILVRGNHDYWWSSISKVRSILPTDVIAIQNDCYEMESVAFCGTRGWIPPGSRGFTAHDQKIFNREIQRLTLSLNSVKKHKPIFVLLHYPPFDDRGEETAIVDLLKTFPVSHVVFGHLHGESFNNIPEGVIGNIHYHLVSCDYLSFQLKFITSL